MELAGYEVTPAEEITPLVDATPLRISASQLKLLKTQIRACGLDEERVERWVKTAWHIKGLNFLTPEMFEKLLSRLEKWASDEYAKCKAEKRG
jgi:hypothetical protein